MNAIDRQPPLPARSRVEAFDVFISYSTNPDYALARDLERFLTTFHQLPGIEKHGLSPLSVCVDGSTFLQRRRGRVRKVDDVVREHLARSKQLLVLCSAGAVGSTAVAAEIKSFLDSDRAGDVHLAVTEGTDPGATPETYFPALLRAAGLVETIWFDLRGYRSRPSRDWVKVRDFGRERVRLAAELLAAVGKSRDLTAADLYPDWLEQERRAARKKLRRAWAVAGALGALALLATALGTVDKVLGDLSEVRRRAAEARALVELEPERGLNTGASAWTRLKELEWRSRATRLQPELGTARAEVLQALFTSLTSHPGFLGPVGTVRVSPLIAGNGDGRLIALVDASEAAPLRSRIELWQLRGDRFRKVAERWLGGRVQCLDMATAGNRLLAASRRYVGIYGLAADGTVTGEHVIDLATTDHAEVSCSAALLDPGGERAWIGTNDGKIVQLATATGVVQPWAGNLGGIVNGFTVEAAGDPPIAAVWTGGSSLRIVAGNHHDAPQPFAGVAAPARALASDAAAGVLVTAHEDGTVAVWSARRHQLLTSARLSQASIVDVVELADPEHFAIGSEAGELIAFELSAGAPSGWALRKVAHAQLFRGPVTSLARTPDGGVIAASPQAPARRWRPGAARSLATILADRTTSSLGLGLSAASAAERLWAFGQTTVLGWHRSERRWSGPEAVFSVAATERLKIGAVAPGRGLVALLPEYGAADERLRLAAVGSRGPALALAGAVSSTARVVFSPSENLLAAGAFARPQRILVWSTSAPLQGPKKLVDAKGEPVAALAFSPDETRLAASDLSGCVRLWNLANATSGRLDCREDDQPGALSWDSSTGQLAIGWLTGQISVVTPGRSREPRILVGHRESISALGFDPSGRWLLSASSDGALVLWDTGTWTIVGEVDDAAGTDSFVRDLAVAPSGAWAALLGQGGSRLSVWSLDPDQWARQARWLSGEPVD